MILGSIQAVKAPVILCLFLAPTLVYGQSLNEFADGIGEGTQHAMKQVGSLMALLFAATFLGGLAMFTASIRRWMNTEPNERETMSAGKLMAGLTLGAMAMVLPLVIAVGHNTMWFSEGITAQEFHAFAIDGNLAQQSALAIREGPGRFVPGGTLIAFYGVLILMGSISIYFGLRDAYISVMYGNDMYGTSLPFKSGKILSHIFFGFAIIFINQTQCVLVLTFGGSKSMCW